MKKSHLFLMTLLTSSLLCAQDALLPQKVDVTWGGDIRFRYVSENNFPNEKHGQKTNTDYTRFRTRIWGKATYQKLEAFLRVGNEFRYYISKEGDKGKQRFPDVTYIDNLYLRYKDDDVEVKVGRQEMAFGAKRIISDGTGGDGSRTTYFDAARATFQLTDKRTLDLFAVYAARHDWLPTAGHTHNARSKGTKSYDYDLPGYNHNEYGFGLYYTDKTLKEMPWEAYYVWKFEEGEHSSVYDSEVSGNTFQTHTFGLRLCPSFTKALSGDFEAALQLGDESLFAGMAYAGLIYKTDWRWSPVFTGAIHYMSGDREGGRGHHAWHAVFNRETGVADSVAPMFNKYAYTNYLYPHLKATLSPTEHTTLIAETGPLFAPTNEVYKEERYGHFRGYLVKAKYEVALGEILVASRFGQSLSRPDLLTDLVFSLSAEYLTKGDTFDEGADDDAYFFQFEVKYSF